MKDRVPVIITNILDRLAKNKDDLAAKFGEVEFLLAIFGLLVET